MPLIPWHRARYDKFSWNVGASSKIKEPDKFFAFWVFIMLS
jgi:hypothetical protein